MNESLSQKTLDTKTGHAVHSTLLPFFVSFSEQLVPRSFFVLQISLLFVASENTFVASSHRRNYVFTIYTRNLQKYVTRARKNVGRTGLMSKRQSCTGQIQHDAEGSNRRSSRLEPPARKAQQQQQRMLRPRIGPRHLLHLPTTIIATALLLTSK